MSEEETTVTEEEEEEGVHRNWSQTFNLPSVKMGEVSVLWLLCKFPLFLQSLVKDTSKREQKHFSEVCF